MVDNFDFNRHNVILVGMIDRRLSNPISFITKWLRA